MATLTGLLLAGISYDPEIRGVLVVVVFSILLVGSVYLLLGSNVGARLGIGLVLTALFGWMMLLSVFWWMYGVGAIGELPAWTIEEVNVGDLSQAELEEARVLVPEDLPTAEQILADNPDIAEQFEPGDEPNLSEIAALPDLPEDVADQLDNLPGDWSVVSTADLGDAQSSADEALISEELGIFTSTGEYVFVGAFEQGGKPERESDSIIDRVTNRITNTLTVLNPPKYVVVQVQTSEPTFVPPGNAPLSPEADEDEPVVSVIMVRDLGTRRLPSAVLTFVFGGLFALSAWLLHRRESVAERLSTAPTGD